MDDQDHKSRSRFKPIYLLYALLIAAGMYLVIYHGPHLWTVLPLLFLLSCPLMHMMHDHHGKHEGSEHEHNHNEKTESNKEKKGNDTHKGCH